MVFLQNKFKTLASSEQIYRVQSPEQVTLRAFVNLGDDSVLIASIKFNAVFLNALLTEAEEDKIEMLAMSIYKTLGIFIEEVHIRWRS